EVRTRRIGNRVDPIALCTVLLAGRQPVRPDDGPRRRGTFPGDRGRCLDRIDAILRSDSEQDDDVGVLGLVVRLPIAHLLVLEYPGLVTVFTLQSCGLCR